MDHHFTEAMRQAVRATQAQDPAAATRIIQEALAGQRTQSGATGPASAQATGRPRRLIDPEAEVVEPLSAPGSGRGATARGAGRRPRRPLNALLRALRDHQLADGSFGLDGGTARAPSPLPDGARFEERSFSCAAGGRDYKLYVPAALPDGPQGLIVMLHGCKQNPDDFARGTAMNALAEAHGLLVAYPRQTNAENASACWNWFAPMHQSRGAGEPAILAGLAEAVATEFGIDRRRIFAAGLSAGGAMAAVLGATYGDVFSGVGVHSGLAHGSAHDVISAFAAMRGDGVPASQAAASPVPTIIFHGTADRTVHPVNAQRLAEGVQSRPGLGRSSSGRSAGGRAYSRSVVAAGETPLLESWLVEGAGHAWSGGDASGSYTDPTGPDASAEMVRFFLSLGAETAG